MTKPLWIRSTIIGPPEGVCADPSAGASHTSVLRMSARRMLLLLVLRAQAHVERRRLAAAHLDVGDVGAIAAFADLNRVRAVGELDGERVLPVAGAAPLLAIHHDVGVAGLDTDGDAAVAGIRCGAARVASRIARVVARVARLRRGPRPRRRGA